MIYLYLTLSPPYVGKVKRIPPSANAMVIFAAKYIRTFIPGAIFFVTGTLLKRRREMK